MTMWQLKSKTKIMSLFCYGLVFLFCLHPDVQAATDTSTTSEDPPEEQSPVNDAANFLNSAQGEAMKAAARAAEQQDSTEVDSQEKAQENATSNKSGGAKMANLLGMGLMAAGGIMLATGQAMQASPPTAAQGATLSKLGLYTLAGGAASMLVGMMMGKDAGKSANYDTNLGDLSNFSGDGGTTFDPNTFGGGGSGGGSNGVNSGANPTATLAGPGSSGSSIDFSPDDLRNGTLGQIFDKFEAETGISRDDFANGIKNGISPAELLKGQGGLSQEQIQAGIDAATAANDFGNGSGGIGSSLLNAANEAGLGDLAAELAANLENNDGSGAVAYSKSGRGLASTEGKSEVKKFDFNSLADKKPMEKVFDAGSVDFSDLSEQVRNQLIKEGRSGKSLFEMVSTQYRKQTPIIFGEDPDKVFQGRLVPVGLGDGDTFEEI